MQTAFKRVSGLARTTLWLSAIALGVLTAYRFTTFARRPSADVSVVSDSDWRIARARALSAWRGSADVRQAIEHAKDPRFLPVTLRDAALPATPESQQNPTSPETATDQLAQEILSAEQARCVAIQGYIAERNQLISERDALVAAHRRRMEKITVRFPAAGEGPNALVAELTQSFNAIKGEAESITIQTTRGSRGYVVSSESGTSHWRREINAIESALQSLSGSSLPYELGIAAENTISRIDVLRAEIDKIPVTRQRPNFGR